MQQQLEVLSISASLFVSSQLSYFLSHSRMHKLLLQIQHPGVAIEMDFHIKSALDNGREAESAEVVTVFAE